MGAFAGVAVGEILFVIMTLKCPQWAFGFNPLIVCWGYAMVVMTVVSLMTRRVSDETLQRHFSR